jgi:hypothetical protein
MFGSSFPGFGGSFPAGIGGPLPTGIGSSFGRGTGSKIPRERRYLPRGISRQIPQGIGTSLPRGIGGSIPQGIGGPFARGVGGMTPTGIGGDYSAKFDPTDDFSVDRSTSGASFSPPPGSTVQFQGSTPQTNTPARPIVMSTPQRTSGQPADRNPFSPGRGYARGRDTDKMPPGRRERGGRSTENDKGVDKRGPTKAEMVKRDLLDKAKQKRAKK